MDVLLPIVLLFAAGTATALALGWLLPALGHGVPGALCLGGLGGVMIGELKDHITGAHQMMNGAAMAGMPMVAATDPEQTARNLIWGAGGGAVFLLLAVAIGSFVPGGRRR